jgi:Holliday junction resolvase RusA-like endonuclease
MYSITDFPFPPSENQIFSIIKLHGVMRKIKSKKYVEYTKQVAKWCFLNMHQINKAKNDILHEQELTIYIYMYSADKWYTKKGEIKKADAANYLKAALDELCKSLLIDDSRFFEVNCRKIVNLADDRNYLNFVITGKDK